MSSKILIAALGIALSAASFRANAQKVYNEGVATYTVSTPQGDIDTKTSFRGDSVASTFEAGPATITSIATKGYTYLAVLVDVPVAQIKKAGVATPAEIEETKSQFPTLTFTPTTETKQIAGFNCKKVIAKDAKGASYDIWITNDITIPGKPMVSFLAGAGGFPVQYVSFQMGQTANVKLKSITEQKVPAGTFGIPKDFDKISLTELREMGKQQ